MTNATETTPQPANPHIVIHVGKGLVQHITGKTADVGDEALVDMMEEASEKYFGRDKLIGRNCTYLPLPEANKDESWAATYILQEYQASLNRKGILFVATLSKNVLEAVLAALVHIKHHREVLVCCHLDEENPGHTLSWMDDEGFLENWSYGALDASVSESLLNKMKFPTAA